MAEAGNATIEERLEKIEANTTTLLAQSTLLVEIAHLHSQRFDAIDKRLNTIERRLEDITAEA